MDLKSVLNLIIIKIFPLVVLMIGLIGNALGSIVMRKPKLKNIGLRTTYQYLFFMDTFYLLEIIVNYLEIGFLIQLTSLNRTMCKTLSYFNFAFAAVSPMLIVFISIDRYISISYPKKRFFIRKEKTQLIYFLVVILLNLLWYMPVYLTFDQETVLNQTTNQTIKICKVPIKENRVFITVIDFSIRVFLPFFFMLTSSILLIYTLFKSRNRIVENFLAEENKTFYNEIRFAITSISLNLIYIFLNLPITLSILIPEYFSFLAYVYSYYLFYLSYAINFYVLLISNSLFKKEFFRLFA